MASNKNQKPKAEVKAKEKSKLELAKSVLKKEKVAESKKQKGIYLQMGKFTVVRN